MSRYDRSQYFEALVVMRNSYAERSDEDRSSSLMIHDAAAYAEAVMQALEAEENAAELDAIAAAASESMLSAETSD